MPAQWHTARIHFCHTEPQATSFHGLVGQLGGGCRGCARWYDAAWLAQLVRFALEGILHLNAAHKTPSIRLHSVGSMYTYSYEISCTLSRGGNVSVRMYTYMYVCIYVDGYGWLVRFFSSA